VRQLALNTDIAPTLGAWAGAVVPKAVDGRSLARLASGLGEPVWRKSFLTELNGRFIQLRTDRYSYTRNVNGFVEFYDLVNDPYELVNRYDSLPRSRIAKLNAQTVALSTCISSSCVALENVAPK
jgi:arylsulfatase A-like enzyme